LLILRWIYTPPGYERGNTRYPVFYLLHGSGNVEPSRILTGRANYIMDNLIAGHKAKPMILVMPYGYSAPGVGTGPLVVPSVAAPPAARTAGRSWATKMWLVPAGRRSSRFHRS